MKRHAALATLVALSAIAAAPASSYALRKPRITQVSLLYVVNAAAGTLTPGPGGHLTLALSGLEHHAVWFSDRPVRRSGAFPASEIAAAWNGFGFRSDPPNAAVDYTDPTRGFGRTVILELTHPRYRHGTLKFTARVIDPTAITSGDLAGHARRADSTPPRHLAEPTLFIDDTTAPVINGCILQPYTDCTNANLSGANLSNIDLAYANLAGANLVGADVVGSNLVGPGAPPLSSPTLFSHANLSGADLAGEPLYWMNFSYANLTKANLSNTYAWGIDLQDSDLTEANFTNANLGDSNLQWSFLTGTNFTGANLNGASLTGAQNLNTAVVCQTTFPGGSVLSFNCP